MTKLEEQLLIYRAAQRARKEKEAREAEEARKAEEAKKLKEIQERAKGQENSQSSLLNYLLPSPPPAAPPRLPRREILRPEPRIAYLRDGDEDEDGMYIDYVEDVRDFDYGYRYEEDETRWTKKDIAFASIKFMVYAFLQYMAVKSEWGAVFFAVSLLYFVYYNTRTRQRMIGEPSAYSVFNDGCEPIDGAMDANRLINQLTLGQMAL